MRRLAQKPDPEGAALGIELADGERVAQAHAETARAEAADFVGVMPFQAIGAESVVSSVTCSRVKILRSSTALGRGGTSSESVFSWTTLGTFRNWVLWPARCRRRLRLFLFR